MFRDKEILGQRVDIQKKWDLCKKETRQWPDWVGSLWILAFILFQTRPKHSNTDYRLWQLLDLYTIQYVGSRAFFNTNKSTHKATHPPQKNSHNNGNHTNLATECNSLTSTQPTRKLRNSTQLNYYISITHTTQHSSFNSPKSCNFSRFWYCQKGGWCQESLVYLTLLPALEMLGFWKPLFPAPFLSSTNVRVDPSLCIHL